MEELPPRQGGAGKRRTSQLCLGESEPDQRRSKCLLGTLRDRRDFAEPRNRAFPKTSKTKQSR